MTTTNSQKSHSGQLPLVLHNTSSEVCHGLLFFLHWHRCVIFKCCFLSLAAPAVAVNPASLSSGCHQQHSIHSVQLCFSLQTLKIPEARKTSRRSAWTGAATAASELPWHGPCREPSTHPALFFIMFIFGSSMPLFIQKRRGLTGGTEQTGRKEKGRSKLVHTVSLWLSIDLH